MTSSPGMGLWDLSWIYRYSLYILLFHNSEACTHLICLWLLKPLYAHNRCKVLAILVLNYLIIFKILFMFVEIWKDSNEWICLKVSTIDSFNRKYFWKLYISIRLNFMLLYTSLLWKFYYQSKTSSNICCHKLPIEL